jgi:hypothetical protein
MSMFLLPITVALLGAPHAAPTQPAVPVASSVRDAAGSELMEEVWRRYRRLASASVTASGIRRYANGRIEPVRTRTMIAADGQAKVIGSSYNLTLKDGVAYADSPFFSGLQIRVKVGTGENASVNALASAWPADLVPLSLRLRLSTSPESGFADLLAFAGETPDVTAQVGVWTDGRACRILRIRSADGATDLALWIDEPTGFARGLRGSIAAMNGEPASTIEVVYETTELDRNPMIAVANRGVRPVDSYDAMLRAWSETYAVPAAPGAGE